MQKKIIIYIIIIIVILIAVFLSQQAYSQDVIKNILSFIEKYSGASLLGGLTNLNSQSNNSLNNSLSNTTNGSGTTPNLLNDGAYVTNNAASRQLIENKAVSPGIGGYIANGLKAVSGVPKKVSESIKSGGEAIQNEAIQAQQNISDAEKNLQNYFSGISDAIQGKENNSGSCQCPVSQ